MLNKIVMTRSYMEPPLRQLYLPASWKIKENFNVKNYNTTLGKSHTSTDRWIKH